MMKKSPETIKIPRLKGGEPAGLIFEIFIQVKFI